MELIELLKKLKHVKAEPAYTRRSRFLILGEAVGLERPSRHPWQLILHSLQFGSAVALAGLLLVLIVGGFSAWRFLSPFQLSSLDPQSLRAEAQEVDIQIQLTNIAYPESLQNATSTVETALTPKTKEIKRQAEKQAEGLGLKPVTSTTKETSIDEALDRLSE